MLTPAEHEAIALLAKAWNLISDEIVGTDETWGDDTREAAHHIHALQRMIMAQAAARAYPRKYRLLGEVL